MTTPPCSGEPEVQRHNGCQSELGYSVYSWGRRRSDVEFDVAIWNQVEQHRIKQLSLDVGMDDEAFLLTTDGQLKSLEESVETSNSVGNYHERPVSKKTMLENVTSIASGKFHSAAINSDGQVFTWGVQVTMTPERAYPFTWLYNDKPVLVQGLSHVKIKQVYDSKSC